MNESYHIEWFKKQIGKAARSLDQAERRGDEEAIKGLRKKMEHYRAAIAALKLVRQLC